MSRPTCFVIQRFDGGIFDKRFTEVFEPALEKAGVEALRADKILGTKPIIQKIEQAIQQATICLAEISTSNENVWLELGYALALEKPCLILCEKNRREQIPFDVAHRPVTFYDTSVPSDFVKVAAEITENSKTAILQSKSNSKVLQKTVVDENLELQQNEIDLLIELVGEGIDTPDHGVSGWVLKNQMEAKGYSKASIGLGIKQLSKQRYIDEHQTVHTYNAEPYTSYSLLPKADEWIMRNSQRLNLLSPNQPSVEKQLAKNTIALDDEIPF